jgi:hypothetical protein
MENVSCVDIVYHDAPMERNENIPQFEIIGFNCRSTPVKRTPVTIATILLK